MKNIVFQAAAVIWLFVEIGLFLQPHITCEQDVLYWLSWTFFVSTVALFSDRFDIHKSQNNSSDETQKHQNDKNDTQVKVEISKKQPRSRFLSRISGFGSYWAKKKSYFLNKVKKLAF